MPAVKMPKRNTRVKFAKENQRTSPVAVSIGPHLVGASQPHVCLDDTATALAGVVKRVASVHPVPDPELLVEFGKYVDVWLERNLVPLPADSDVSVEHWLSGTNYPLWRREELIKKHAEVVDEFDARHLRVKCFVKDERYPEYKHARGIYSRTDEFKCFVGPYFKLIEEEIYKLPQFIKHVPVSKRPEYITEYLSGDGVVYATDYTAFESQFRFEIMRACEFKLYSYMTSKVSGHSRFMRHVEAIGGRQRCSFKNFSFDMDTSRMSGEMCTSLGNGFSNLMFASFIASLKGDNDLRIVVEGDDGLFKSRHKFLAEDFARLGLTIGIIPHNRLATASFCGIIFDPEEQVNLTNPLEVLADFGWASRQYVGANAYKRSVLLRCKSLSLAHQYPGCPIISALARYGLRVTRHVRTDAMQKHARSGGMSLWDRDQLRAALSDERNLPIKECGIRTRLLVEELFGISVTAQENAENYLDSLTEIQPLRIPELLSLCPQSWIDYYDRFTVLGSLSHLEDFSAGVDGRNHLQELLNLCHDSCR